MRYLYPLLLLLIMLLSGVYHDNSVWIYGLLGLTLFSLLRKIGKGIALREMIAVHSCIIYLLMPLLGYQVYNSNNALSRLWWKFMPVDEVTYFNFVLPAILAFLLGLFMPSATGKHDPDDNETLLPVFKKSQAFLKSNKPWVPMLILGLVGYFFKNINSISALTFFVNSFYLLLFSAILCIYFSPGLKRKAVYISIIVLLILYEAIQTGMFTVVVYMGVVMGSIIFIGSRIAFWKKLAIMTLTVFFIITLQTTKGTFRKKTWGKTYEGSKTELFTDLMKENFSNYNNIFDRNAFFPLYARMNQGYNTALVMRRIPTVQDFDDGHSIYLTVASALLPRVIWEDKLEAGGVYNMKHFADMTIVGWSTNIGPVGEAYGNFGLWGGELFMFIFGLFIRVVYFKVLRLAHKLPLLIFWIPVLFFELSYSMENDTLQALNSIIKVAIFTLVFYLIAPALLGVYSKRKKNAGRFTIPEKRLNNGNVTG